MEMEKTRNSKHKPYRPNVDKGWAWVVVIASYLGMILLCITLYMSGVLLVALLERFEEGEAKTSLVGAVTSGVLCFIAPIAGALNNKYSCRVSIVLGGCFTTLGFVSSAFVPDLNWMIVTLGALVGLGYGISSSGLICVVGFYFEKWRDQVLSVAYLGIGVAMFISVPFGLYLLNEYGLSMTLIILGGIQAQMCVLGMLCKPSVIETEVHQVKRKHLSENKESLTQSYVDFGLMLRKSYLLFLISTSSWNFALIAAIMHLPNYVSTIGGSSSDIGWLMTAFSIANLIGRLCGSLTVSKLRDKSLHTHALVLGISGTVTSLYPLYSSVRGGAYIFAIQLGILTGCPNTMMTPLSLSFVGVSKLSEAYGLAYIFCGIGVSIGPVITGYLYRVTGSYENSFIVAGLVLVSGSLCAVGSICCGRGMTEQEVVLIVETSACEKRDIPGSDKPFLDSTACHQTDNKGNTVENERGSSPKRHSVDEIFIEQEMPLLFNGVRAVTNNKVAKRVIV